MKRFFYTPKMLTTLCCLCCCIFSYAQDLIWASHLTGSARLQYSMVHIDMQGNTYAVGHNYCDTLFATSTGTSDSILLIKTIFSNNNTDGFIIKYDPQGAFLWKKAIGGDRGDYVADITSDPLGNIYITGMFNDVVDFNPGGTGGVVTGKGYNDAFLAKYDADGKFLWVNPIGGETPEGGDKVRLDTLGNVYIMGGYYNNNNFQDSVDFNIGGTGGKIFKHPEAAMNVFIAKYDTAGNYKWALGIADPALNAAVYSNGFAVSPSGEIYISGYLMKMFMEGKSLKIDGFDISGAGTGYFTGFVAKCNTDGRFEWSYDIGGLRANAIAATNDGNVLFTGSFSGTQDLDFSSGTSTATAIGSDVYLSKYKPDGSFIWGMPVIGGTGNQLSSSIATDLGGNIHLMGTMANTGNFNLKGDGSDTIRTKGGTDLFIAKYRPDGDYVWARTIGGTGNDAATGLIVSNRGLIAATGTVPTVGIDVNPDPIDTLVYKATVAPDLFVIQLSCNDTSSASISETVECGSPYTLNGETYTDAGIYTQYLPNVAGCDSVLTFELVYEFLNSPSISVNEKVLSTSDEYSSYQWLKDRTVLEGETKSELHVTQNGDYQVIVFNEYGCSDTSDAYTVNNATAIDDLNGMALQLFPNPTQDIVNIRSKIAVGIELTSIDGRVLLTKENVQHISLKALPAGVYLVKIKDIYGNLIKTEKVIKE